MHGETSDAAKRRVERVAELAVGSGDETASLLAQHMSVGWRCDHDFAGAVCETCFANIHHAVSVATAPVQTPAPDPDEACDGMCDQVMAERDEYYEWADRLAYAIASVEVIGEHTSANNPWQNAYDLAVPITNLTPDADPDETCVDVWPSTGEHLDPPTDSCTCTPAPPAMTGPADEGCADCCLLSAEHEPNDHPFIQVGDAMPETSEEANTDPLTRLTPNTTYVNRVGGRLTVTEPALSTNVSGGAMCLGVWHAKGDGSTPWLVSLDGMREVGYVPEEASS